MPRPPEGKNDPNPLEYSHITTPYKGTCIDIANINLYVHILIHTCLHRYKDHLTW